MISAMAREDAERLAKDGVMLTFDDCVRLNALGMKVERSSRSAEDFAIPRAAFAGGCVFREPTIAHWLWIERAERSIDAENDRMIHAAALTVRADKLCDPDEPREVRRAVKDAQKRMRNLTLRQIDNALAYVIGGDTSSAPNAARNESHDDGSVSAGMMITAAALRIGTLDEIRSLTISDIWRIARMQRQISGIAEQTDMDAHAQYCIFVDELEKRKEADNGDRSE